MSEVLRPAFSLTRAANGFIFVSGQLPFGADNQIVPGSVAEQTRLCLRRIGDALAPLGLNLSDVVKTTVWLSRTEDFPAFNQAYAEVFSGICEPARSTVRADLMVAGASVEIEAIAKQRGAA